MNYNLIFNSPDREGIEVPEEETAVFRPLYTRVSTAIRRVYIR